MGSFGSMKCVDASAEYTEFPYFCVKKARIFMPSHLKPPLLSLGWLEQDSLLIPQFTISVDLHS